MDHAASPAASSAASGASPFPPACRRYAALAGWRAFCGAAVLGTWAATLLVVALVPAASTFWHTLLDQVFFRPLYSGADVLMRTYRSFTDFRGGGWLEWLLLAPWWAWVYLLGRAAMQWFGGPGAAGAAAFAVALGWIASGHRWPEAVWAALPLPLLLHGLAELADVRPDWARIRRPVREPW